MVENLWSIEDGSGAGDRAIIKPTPNPEEIPITEEVGEYEDV